MLVQLFIQLFHDGIAENDSVAFSDNFHCVNCVIYFTTYNTWTFFLVVSAKHEVYGLVLFSHFTHLLSTVGEKIIYLHLGKNLLHHCQRHICGKYL